MKAAIITQQQYIEHAAGTSAHLVFHRPLTPAEAQAIWALLSSARLSGDHQELHISVRCANGTPRMGWVTHTAERPVPCDDFALAAPEPRH
jgi:hypothetical protein